MTTAHKKHERSVRGRAGEHAARAIAADQRTVWVGPDPDAMHGAVAIGAIVAVPQIRAAWGRRVLWTPVRGSGHHDVDVFDFEAWHWHVDLRFADAELYDLIGWDGTSSDASGWNSASSFATATRREIPQAPERRTVSNLATDVTVTRVGKETSERGGGPGVRKTSTLSRKQQGGT